MPSWFWVIIFFAYGAVVGSFLNVVIWRVPREESLWSPPSHCPSCNRRVKWYDLIPIVSQLLLRARCRHCGARFSWRYLWVELITALAFTAMYARFGAEGRWVEAIAGSLFCAVLVVVFFIDLDHYIIPDDPIFIGIGIGVLQDLWLWHTGVPEHQPLRLLPFTDFILPFPIPVSLVNLAIGALGLLLVAGLGRLAFGKEAMGMGDVFLIAAMGANLTLPHLAVAFFLAVFIGSLVGIGLMLLQRKKKQDPIPFGPMLVTGTFLAMLFGEPIVRFYMGTLWNT
jgi:leader peptidase (prepilin peptidase) / N-methyltransferase